MPSSSPLSKLRSLIISRVDIMWRVDKKKGNRTLGDMLHSSTPQSQLVNPAARINSPDKSTRGSTSELAPILLTIDIHPNTSPPQNSFQLLPILDDLPCLICGRSHMLPYHFKTCVGKRLQKLFPTPPFTNICRFPGNRGRPRT